MRFRGLFKKIISTFLSSVFILVSCLPQADAQMLSVVAPLPAAGGRLTVTPAFQPLMIKGLTIDKNDPFRFEFLMNSGDTRLEAKDFEDESYKMIRYFLASLSIPEEEMWVNLSPYEHDRIVPETFGATEMGRDLLAQDYILKQLTSSLMSPDDETGKKFWEEIYKTLEASGQNIDVSVNTFNKVWIVPQTGYFYEHDNTVFIADARLKVMLESDYLAREKSVGAGLVPAHEQGRPQGSPLQKDDTKSIIREIIIPIIEKEVNEGAHFANLRQIYNAMLLSVWFKKRLKEHVLGQVYMNQSKVNGEVQRSDIDGIWQKYVEAFKSGASDVIREEYDPATQTVIPRKYFTGGAVAVDDAQMTNAEAVMRNGLPDRRVVWLADGAMMGKETQSPENLYSAFDPQGLMGFFKNEAEFRNILGQIRKLSLEDPESYEPKVRKILDSNNLDLNKFHQKELINIARFLNDFNNYNKNVDAGLEQYKRIEKYFSVMSGQVIEGTAYRFARRHHLQAFITIEYLAKKYGVKFTLPATFNGWLKFLKGQRNKGETLDLPYTIEEIKLMFRDSERLKSSYNKLTLPNIMANEYLMSAVTGENISISYHTQSFEEKLARGGFLPRRSGDLTERILLRISEYEQDFGNSAESILGDNYRELIPKLSFDVQRIFFIYSNLDRMMFDLGNYLDRLRGIDRDKTQVARFSAEFISRKPKMFYEREAGGILSRHWVNVEFIRKLTSRELAELYGLPLDRAVKAIDTNKIKPAKFERGSIEEWGYYHPFIVMGEMDRKNLLQKHNNREMAPSAVAKLLLKFGIVLLNEFGPFLSEKDLEIPVSQAEGNGQVKDKAMMALVHVMTNKGEWHQGGINLRSDQADIRIQTSESGFQFPQIDPAMLEHPLEKLVPTIINISPIQPQEAMRLLGMNEEEDPQPASAHDQKDRIVFKEDA